MILEIYLDNAFVASKNCAMVSVGDTDSVSATCGSVSVEFHSTTNYKPYNGQPSYQTYFRLIEAPARGYRLVRHVQEYQGSGSGTPPDEDITLNTPFEYPTSRQDNALCEYHNTRRPNGTWLVVVRAYFEKVPRSPTHLLVNNSTAENPAKLVYDPATNLLVADY